MKLEYPEKTTDLLQVTDKLYYFFFFLGWMSFSIRPLVTSAPKQLQIINVLVYMLLCHGEDFKSSSKYNTCSIFFWIDAWMGTVAASGNSQLPCPLYWVCLSDTCCVSYVIYNIGIIQYYCYILLFYCYTVLCVYITHCTYIYLIIVMILP